MMAPRAARLGARRKPQRQYSRRAPSSTGRARLPAGTRREPPDRSEPTRIPLQTCAPEHEPASRPALTRRSFRVRLSHKPRALEQTPMTGAATTASLYSVVTGTLAPVRVDDPTTKSRLAGFVRQPRVNGALRPQSAPSAWMRSSSPPAADARSGRGAVASGTRRRERVTLAWFSKAVDGASGQRERLRCSR